MEGKRKPVSNSFKPLILGMAAGAVLIAGNALARPPPSQTASFTLEAACRQVFPLFTAAGERLWAGPNWNPEMLSGSFRRGSVFRTRAHGRETVWVVTDYRPDQGRVNYARIAQGSNMGLVGVRCHDLLHHHSRITVSYTLTALSPEGATFVRRFLGKKNFKGYIGEWKQSIDKFLQSAASHAAQTGG